MAYGIPPSAASASSFTAITGWRSWATRPSRGPMPAGGPPTAGAGCFIGAFSALAAVTLKFRCSGLWPARTAAAGPWFLAWPAAVVRGGFGLKLLSMARRWEGAAEQDSQGGRGLVNRARDRQIPTSGAAWAVIRESFRCLGVPRRALGCTQFALTIALATAPAFSFRRPLSAVVPKTLQWRWPPWRPGDGAGGGRRQVDPAGGFRSGCSFGAGQVACFLCFALIAHPAGPGLNFCFAGA